MSLTEDQFVWLQRNKAMAGGGSASVAHATPTAAGQRSGALLQSMTADCKVVHGKVPGPENHLLCVTHGHIVDVKARTIIAHDLKDYEARDLGGQHAAASHDHPAPHQAPPNAAAPAAQPPPAAPPSGAPLSGATNTAAQPSAGGHPAAPPGPAAVPPAASASGQTKKTIDAVAMQVIANQIVEYLHNQYVDLADAVAETTSRWSSQIDKLKEAAPKEPGSLLSQLGSALASLTVLVFPELEVVKITMEVKEIADKGAEADEKAKEAAEAKAVFAAKMQAKDALNRFAGEVKKEAREARSKLVARVRAAVKEFAPPPDFDDRILEDMDKYAQEFAVKYLGIKIGKDYDPGAVAKIQQKLGTEIGHWMKEQYIEEHELEKTSKQDPSFALMMTYLPPDLKAEKMEEFFKDNPDIKARIDEELGDDYYDEFRKKVWGEKD